MDTCNISRIAIKKFWSHWLYKFYGVKKAVHSKATLSMCLYLLAVFYFLSLNFLYNTIPLPGPRGARVVKYWGGGVWEKNHRFTWRANQWPIVRETFTLPFLPATFFFLSWTLERLFELTQPPSRAVNMTHFLPSKLKRYKDTVRCVCS